jgi:outer membrane protein assembly factor BamB
MIKKIKIINLSNTHKNKIKYFCMNSYKSSFTKKMSVVCVALMISSCSLLPEWIGEGKKNSGLKGERISVLELDKAILSSEASPDLKILIPEQHSNKSWFKSSGRHYLVAENSKLAGNFPVKYEVSIGGGSSDGAHMMASPIVADGKVFISTASGEVAAFNAFDIRKPIWKTTLNITNKDSNPSSAAGMIYHIGYIYIATGSNQIIALRANSGKMIWNKTISSIARSAPEVRDNTLYINTIDNRLYAMNASDGSILWTHTGGSEDISVFGSASPTLHDNIVIAPYSSGEVYALRADNGQDIWNNLYSRRSIGISSTLSDIDATPIVSNGKVFIISNDGILASTDLKTGQKIWEQEISGRQSPWVAGDFLYLITNSNEIVCIHAQTGIIKWVQQLQKYKNVKNKKDAIEWSGPVLAGNFLWVVNSNGKMAAISPHDGTIKYERSVPKNIYISPVVAYDSIYLYTDDAELIQLTTKDRQKSQIISKNTSNLALTNETSAAQSKTILNKIKSGTDNITDKIIKNLMVIQ